VIELDGSQHFEDQQIEKDKERTIYLEGYGLRIFRITNHEINKNFEGVCQSIDHIIKQSLSQLR